MISQTLKEKFSAVYPEGAINENINSFGLKCYQVRFTKFGRLITFHINNETDLIKRLDLDRMIKEKVNIKHKTVTSNNKFRYRLYVTNLSGYKHITDYAILENAIKWAKIENGIPDNFSVHLVDRTTGEEIEFNRD